MTNLRDHIIEWLDEIGADGLMVNMSSSDHVYLIGSELERAIESWGLDMLVPAFRHADGSYHTDPELTKPCDSCGQRIDLFCQDVVPLLASFAAAQRQAGREEAAERVCKHCGLSSSPCLEKCEIVKVILGEESTR